MALMEKAEAYSQQAHSLFLQEIFTNPPADIDNWIAYEADLLQIDITSTLDGWFLMQWIERVVHSVIRDFGCLKKHEAIVAAVIAKATRDLSDDEQEIQKCVLAIVGILLSFCDKSIDLQNGTALLIRGEEVSLTAINNDQEGFPLIVKSINADTLRVWLEQDAVLLIDVREFHEYEKQNIPGAILIPQNEVHIETLPESEGKHIVIQCRSGKRSHDVCVKLYLKAPWMNLYNLEGGILAMPEELTTGKV